MTDRTALRIVGLAAQAEMALVRRDPVAGALLAQTARAAAATPAGPYLEAAAALVRGRDPADPDDGAVRKLAQALCRAGSILSSARALKCAASEEIG